MSNFRNELFICTDLGSKNRGNLAIILDILDGDKIKYSILDGSGKIDAKQTFTCTYSEFLKHYQKVDPSINENEASNKQLLTILEQLVKMNSTMPFSEILARYGFVRTIRPVAISNTTVNWVNESDKPSKVILERVGKRLTDNQSTKNLCDCGSNTFKTKDGLENTTRRHCTICGNEVHPFKQQSEK